MPVHYQNEQWAVTGFGIECLGHGGYLIAAERLGELRPSSDLPDWPIHLAEKEWVNCDLFLAAFLVALSVHQGKYAPLPNPGWIDPAVKEMEKMSGSASALARRSRRCGRATNG